MIATRRGLLVLVAIACLVAAWLVATLMRGRPAPVDRSIAPGLDVDRVTELVWDRSPQASVKVTAGPAGDWRWESLDVRAAADGGVVRDVLAALRAGRWHRRAEVGAAGVLTARLTVRAGGTSTTIGIGQPLEGTEQQWLVAGEHALLVDRWIVRAIDPGPLALRVRRPVEDAAAAGRIAIERGTRQIRLELSPPRLVAPVTLMPREDALDALARALESLEIVRLSRPATDEDVVLSVTAGGRLRFASRCPEDPALAWLSSDAGDGCIRREAYDAMVGAVEAFEQPAAQLVERRVVPFDVETVVLVDGARLELGRRPAIAGKPADVEGVMELLAALAAPAQVSDVFAAVVKGQLQVTGKGGGTVEVELLGEGRVRRRGEPVALQLTPAAYAALNRRAADLADRAVWTEEASTITELSIDGVTYRRGAVIGEWTRTPPGPVDGARIEAVVAALAEVRSTPAFASLSRRHEVAIVVTPPAGQRVRHELVIGAPRQGGCPAYAGQATVIVPAAVCSEIAALAR